MSVERVHAEGPTEGAALEERCVLVLKLSGIIAIRQLTPVQLVKVAQNRGRRDLGDIILADAGPRLAGSSRCPTHKVLQLLHSCMEWTA